MEVAVRELDALSRGIGPDAPEPALIEVARARVKAGRWLVEHAPEATRYVSDRDCFAGVSGLPDVAASDLDVERLASGLQYHGGLVVRGFLSGDEVAVLRQHIDDAERFRARFDSLDAVEREKLMRMTIELGMLGMTPAALAEILAIYDTNGFSRLARAYLGSRPVLMANRTKLRRGTTESGLPWHQDAAFYGGPVGAVNVWSALTPVGDCCGAVEVVPRRMDGVVGFPGDALANLEAPPPLDYSLGLPVSAIRRILDETPLAAPVLEPGDAMVFDDMTLHRTGTAPWTVPSRDIAITWFFEPARFPRFPRTSIPLAV